LCAKFHPATTFNFCIAREKLPWYTVDHPVINALISVDAPKFGVQTSGTNRCVLFLGVPESCKEPSGNKGNRGTEEQGNKGTRERRDTRARSNVPLTRTLPQECIEVNFV